MSISIIIVNTGEAAEAQRIGRDLVESRLAASANVIDRISSVYRWGGAVRQRDEAQLVIKTRSDLVAAVIARVRHLHSYECPGIIALPVVDGNPEYLDWVARETAE
ncbi:MAG: divalent-cation tolerance protein CutA [Alphaproteobacteria bacterium]|nr:divalent-cation tolerance protein CutA [Alphaproteobacteria bacterium]